MKTAQEQNEDSFPHSPNIDQKSTSWMLGLCVCVFLFLVWACVYKVTVYINATGKVTHEDTHYKVEAQLDGEVADVLIENGQHVKKGEKLMVLLNEDAVNKLKAQQYQLIDYEANILRLNSILNKTPLKFPPQMEKDYFHIVNNQKQLYQLGQDSVKTSITLLNKTKDLMQKELNLILPLADNKAFAEIDKLKLESQISDINSKIADVKNRYELTAAEELSDISTQHEALLEEIKTAQEKIDKTAVLAPMSGTVHGLEKDKVGEYIQKGDYLFEVLPDSKNLIVTGQIATKDIGFITLGSPVEIKIDAYDYQIYGALKGEVIEIGADNMTRDDGTSYFEIRIKTNANQLEHAGKSYPVKPGMTVSASIDINQMPFILYLFKPLSRIMSMGTLPH